MNKNNLIKLGALAQKEFEMKDNFSIMEVASDAHRIIRVVIPTDVPFSDTYSPYGIGLEFDEIVLTKFGSPNNFEFIRCGYSDAANTLVIREAA